MAGKLITRVLLVDDEPRIRMLISECLASAGYIVQTAFDGLDAIGKLRAVLPDLIISDLNMPRMSGVELLAVVRKRFPQIPFVAISAAPDEMPGGVTADAYYHESGAGLGQLLEISSALTGGPPLRSALPQVDNGPVLAKRNRHGQYLVSCQDCLRVFSFPRTSITVREEKWTICVYCGNLVWFLVAGGYQPHPVARRVPTPFPHRLHSALR